VRVVRVTTSNKEALSETSVRKAICEYNRIGEREFHAKYGFGRSRVYFLIFQRKKYPSKAIFACAYGYQFGNPIKYEDNLYGGRGDAARLLRKLGFCVTGPN
jgi:5-methylcytosine-specific restriction protein A